MSKPKVTGIFDSLPTTDVLWDHTSCARHTASAYAQDKKGRNGRKLRQMEVGARALSEADAHYHSMEEYRRQATVVLKAAEGVL